MAMVSHHASVAGPQMFNSNNDATKPDQVINNNGIRNMNQTANVLRQNQIINNLNVSLIIQKLFID